MFRAVMAGMARVAVQTAAFVGRAAGQAADRLVPQGAGELSNALHANHAFHPMASVAPPLQRGGIQPRMERRPDQGVSMDR